METKSCWIHTDEANGGTEDRKERGVAPTTSTRRRQQRGEENKQVKAAADFAVFLFFFFTPPNGMNVIRIWSLLSLFLG